MAEISAYDLMRRIQTGDVKDEWHYMSKTFNELLDRLEKGFEMLRRFISNASHEIPTPLAVILNQLEIAVQKERSAPE